MSDGKIVLFARLKVKEDRIDELKAAALAIVADSRREAGNIHYDVHQSIDDATMFFWHETWTDKAAIDAHFATSFFQDFIAIVSSVAAEPPEISLTRMIS